MGPPGPVTGLPLPLPSNIIHQRQIGERPLGRPRRRCEDNIKMDLQKVGVGYGDWMELALVRDRWQALVGAVMNFRVP
jgi:hypothetical protein